MSTVASSEALLVPALRGDRLRALAWHVELAAREAGRFRSRVQADPELARFLHLADRLADDLEWVLLLLTPTAGDLVAWTNLGDDETAVAALEVVAWTSEATRSADS
jgi:hypothetical protein